MAVNAFRPSESDVGIVINWFPTETIRPMEGLDDGGIIVNWFPTETIRPMESMSDGGIIIDYTPGPDDNVEWPIGPIPELWLI